MINHEFDIIRVLIASQDDAMIKKLILCLTENAYETVTVNNKTDARKSAFLSAAYFAGRPSDSNYE